MNHNLIKKFDKLNFQKYTSSADMGYAAAGQVAEKIHELLQFQDEINIIFAAAPSQNEFLNALKANKTIPWGKINGYHMDEYIGLPAEAQQAFGCFLRIRLFEKVPFKSINLINGKAEDIEAECLRYGDLLDKNSPDIVCMGIGENGHIAFNDPHVALFHDPQSVKVVDLDLKCRQQQVNDGCFPTLEEVPEYAITLTVPALMAGKNIFCMVPGGTKARAVYTSLHGAVEESCPASILRTHNHACLYVDQDSASLL